MSCENKKYIIPFVSPELIISDSVVVVGSSNTTLSNQGSKIDKFKSVIRFNRAPTTGFENHVGSKTSLRVMNNHVFENIKIKNGYSKQPQKFIKKINNSKILRIGPGLADEKVIKKFNKKENEVFLFDFAKLSELKKEIGFESEKNMSVGAVCISLLIISGIKPNIVGFDLDMRITTHYWEERPKKMSKIHDQPYEKSWLKSLVDRSIVNILK